MHWAFFGRFWVVSGPFETNFGLLGGDFGLSQTCGGVPDMCHIVLGSMGQLLKGQEILINNK